MQCHSCTRHSERGLCLSRFHEPETEDTEAGSPTRLFIYTVSTTLNPVPDSQALPIQWSKKYIRYEENESGVTTYFDKGSPATGDVLVGADGINNHGRNHHFEFPTTERPTHNVPGPSLAFQPDRACIEQFPCLEARLNQTYCGSESKL